MIFASDFTHGMSQTFLIQENIYQGPIHFWLQFTKFFSSNTSCFISHFANYYFSAWSLYINTWLKSKTYTFWYMLVCWVLIWLCFHKFPPNYCQIFFVTFSLVLMSISKNIFHCFQAYINSALQVFIVLLHCFAVYSYLFLIIRQHFSFDFYFIWRLRKIIVQFPYFFRILRINFENTTLWTIAVVFIRVKILMIYPLESTCWKKLRHSITV